MKKEEVEKKASTIQIDRIGATCFYDTITCSLEYIERMYWALDYIDYTFFYNKERFLKFKNDDELEKKVSEADKYYFYISPQSSYYGDVLQYTWNLYKRVVGKTISYCKGRDCEFTNIIRSLNEGKLPAILLVNNIEYKEFYSQHNFTVPRSNSNHMVNIFAESEAGDRCFIFDRGFDCFGEWIDTSLLYKGATSKFLKNNGYFGYLYFKNLPTELNTDEITIKMLESIRRAMVGEVEINGTKYLNNTDALRSFKKDLKDIIFFLYEKYGKFSTPLFGETILLHVDGTMGVADLYSEMNKKIKSRSLERTAPLLKDYWKSWSELEKRLKYITYKDEKLYKYVERLLTHVDKMIVLNEKILDGFGDCLRELE